MDLSEGDRYSIGFGLMLMPLAVFFVSFANQVDFVYNASIVNFLGTLSLAAGVCWLVYCSWMAIKEQENSKARG